MLFEFSIAKKYLIPQKKRLAMSLIALMSIGVISIVVWLVLVFLSVIAGMEKGWIHKLTALNAPVRIAPTSEYHASYYYRIDSISAASNYTCKNIAEKKDSLRTNPYTFEEDPAIPAIWPTAHLAQDGSLKDLVKLAFSAIEKTSSPKQKLTAQDYEISAAQLNLQVMSINSRGISKPEAHFSQLSHLSSFSHYNPDLSALIEPPRIKDVNHLLMRASLSPAQLSQQPQIATFQDKLAALFSAMTITRVQTTHCHWRQLADLIPENMPFFATAKVTPTKQIAYVLIPLQKKRAAIPSSKTLVTGSLMRTHGQLFFTSREGKTFPVSRATQLQTTEPLSFAAEWIPTSFDTISALSDLEFAVKTTLQGKTLAGQIHWNDLIIEAATMKTTFSSPPPISPPWPYFVSAPGKKPIACLPEVPGEPPGVVLPKKLQEAGIKIGDSASLVYKTATLSSLQEQLLPATVVGFYDPGIMLVGLRPVLTHAHVIRDINLSTEAPALIPYPTNGIHVWFDDLSQTEAICTQLDAAFDRAGIANYWSITPFYQYEFAQDFFQQFKSDKYLLTLIAALILIVACTNIISLLVILVGEKKREIAILRAMGASKRSIALIFTLCGGIMGLASTLIGIFLAYLTLHNIDTVVHFLSFLQGHEAFNAAFYGKSLPSELSATSLKFIAIATPLLSLLAGLIPALKACRYRPSEILRS
ncbi:MAG: FtsX-like permease family protein [Chlamydiota bacterium]